MGAPPQPAASEKEVDSRTSIHGTAPLKFCSSPQALVRPGFTSEKPPLSGRGSCKGWKKRGRKTRRDSPRCRGGRQIESDEIAVGSIRYGRNCDAPSRGPCRRPSTGRGPASAFNGRMGRILFSGRFRPADKSGMKHRSCSPAGLGPPLPIAGFVRPRSRLWPDRPKPPRCRPSSGRGEAGPGRS